MWLQKLIQSWLFPCGIALALTAGCATADRTEARAEPSVGHEAHGDDDTREARGHAGRGEDDHDNNRPAKSSAEPKRSAKADSAVTAPPSLDELPNLKPQRERSIAARIDVEGSQATTKRPVVPAFKEIPLTPEEKKALGKDRERPDDVMGFYRPGRSVEQGVSSHDSDIRIGVGGRGGALVGTSSNPRITGVFGDAGHHAKVSTVVPSKIGVDSYVPIIVRVGPSFVVQIGIGPSRSGAARMLYLEP